MMSFLAVVLSEPTPNFPRRHPNDGIYGGVVRRLPCEDVDTERALFQRLRKLAQRMFNDPLQKQPTAFARAKKRTFDDAFQLSLNFSRRDRSRWWLGSEGLAIDSQCGVRHDFRAAKRITGINAAEQQGFSTEKNC